MTLPSALQVGIQDHFLNTSIYFYADLLLRYRVRLLPVSQYCVPVPHPYVPYGTMVPVSEGQNIWIRIQFGLCFHFSIEMFSQTRILNPYTMYSYFLSPR